MENFASATDFQIRARRGRGAGEGGGCCALPGKPRVPSCVAPPLARDRGSSSLRGRGPFSDTIQTARLRKASWWTRLTYAHRRDWTVERLAAVCGFDPQGTAAMAARLGIPLRRA